MGPDAPTSSDALLTTQRKQEILGLLLIALAVLLGLAFFSYNPSDDVALEQQSLLSALFSPDPDQGGVHNALGYLGAWLAGIFVPNGLGYFMLVICGLLGWWGHALFRDRTLEPLIRPTLYTVGIILYAAVSIGWIGELFGGDLTRWIGAIGTGIAGGMRHLIGLFGSFLVLSITALGTWIVMSEGDAQDSIDRLINALVYSAHATQRGLRYATAQAHAWLTDQRDALNDKWTDQRSSQSTASQPPQEPPSPPEEPTSTPGPPDTPDEHHLEPKPEPSSSAEAPAEPPAASTSAPSASTPSAPADASPGSSSNEPLPDPAIWDTLDATELQDTDSEEDLDMVDFDEVLHHMEAAPSAPDTNALPPEMRDTSTAPPADPETASAPQDHDDRDGDPNLNNGTPIHLHLPSERAPISETSIPVEAPLSEQRAYTPPPIDLLEPPADPPPLPADSVLEATAQALLTALGTHGISVTDLTITPGPHITRYRFAFATEGAAHRLHERVDEIAMAANEPGAHMLPPADARAASIDIPRAHSLRVGMHEVIATETFRDAKHALPLPLGYTLTHEPLCVDLATLPHLLIAGASGSGGAAALHALLLGMLYGTHPAALNMVLIAPERPDMQPYAHLSDHVVVNASTPDVIVSDGTRGQHVLAQVRHEMAVRQERLQRAQATTHAAYNQAWEAGMLDPDQGHASMPHLVIAIAELADILVDAAPDAETHLVELAKQGASVGIHLVMATERPSVDVITPRLKPHLPARLAYEVASQVDARTILDRTGAEQLLGHGDVLFQHNDVVYRLQGALGTAAEIERVTTHIAAQPPHPPISLSEPKATTPTVPPAPATGQTDPLLLQAARFVVQEQQASPDLLQRGLAIEYPRAARLLDALERAGVVGPFAGKQPRTVRIRTKDELHDLLS